MKAFVIAIIVAITMLFSNGSADIVAIDIVETKDGYMIVTENTQGDYNEYFCDTLTEH